MYILINAVSGVLEQFDKYRIILKFVSDCCYRLSLVKQGLLHHSLQKSNTWLMNVTMYKCFSHHNKKSQATKFRITLRALLYIWRLDS